MGRDGTFSTLRGTPFWVSPEDFPIVERHRWYSVGGYIATTIAKKTVYLHRIIAGVAGKEVDHVDGNKANNTRKNLRVCTHQQNIMGKSAHPNKTSKYKGVSWSKGKKKWMAFITKDYKNYSLGGFDSEVKAFKAYERASLELFGQFAKTHGKGRNQ